MARRWGSAFRTVVSSEAPFGPQVCCHQSACHLLFAFCCLLLGVVHRYVHVRNAVETCLFSQRRAEAALP